MEAVNNDRAKVLSQLEKLLRVNVSRGATQAEMEIAMKKAAEIAFKHRINLEDVSREESQPTIDVGANMEKREMNTLSPKSHTYIQALLKKYFGVVIVTLSPAKVAIVGLPMDIDFAMYAYAYLRVAFLNLWEVEKWENQLEEGSRESFWLGVWTALDKKLAQEKVDMEEAARAASKWAIILVDEHALALQKKTLALFPGLRHKHAKAMRSVDTGAYNNGLEKGAGLSIRKALGGGCVRI